MRSIPGLIFAGFFGGRAEKNNEVIFLPEANFFMVDAKAEKKYFES